MSRHKSKVKALMLFTSVSQIAEYVTGTRSFLDYMGFTVSGMGYNLFKEEDAAKYDIFVFLNPPELDDYDEKRFDEIMTILTTSQCSIIGLGDANARITSFFGYHSDVVENHMLDRKEVHSMITVDKTEYFIPSKHKTVLVADNFGYVNTKTWEDTDEFGFLDIIALSPLRDISRPEVPGQTEEFIEIEMYTIRTLNVLGIYGAPELFFIDNLVPGDNTLNVKTMSYLKKLVTKIFDL